MSKPPPQCMDYNTNPIFIDLKIKLNCTLINNLCKLPYYKYYRFVLKKKIVLQSIASS